jgi:TonB family protein
VARYYPFAARSHGITGESIIDLRIEADGRISSFAIVSSSPPGVFDSALAGLVGSLQADPATAQGKPVASTFRVRIQWTLPR